jgi:two-component system sensor histidine kinase KdpD
VLPRKVLEHRGAELTELDVDAVLARAPEVCVERPARRRPTPTSVSRWVRVVPTSPSRPPTTSS